MSLRRQITDEMGGDMSLEALAGYFDCLTFEETSRMLESPTPADAMRLMVAFHAATSRIKEREGQIEQLQALVQGWQAFAEGRIEEVARLEWAVSVLTGQETERSVVEFENGGQG